jgi:prepilin-type N-terminal cleavage/methylation domain-containing protein
MTKLRGFSLLELMIAVIAIGVVATILLNRLFYYQELAEKAEMEYTINAVKSALRLRMAGHLVAGQAQHYVLLAKENPMDWLELKPRNYQGLLPNSPADELIPGSWYFDATAKTLIYIVKHGAHLQTSATSPKQIRWQISFLRNQPESLDTNGVVLASDSVAIKAISSYKWF